MEIYPRAAMERAIKVQDVMLQAMAKKITWWQAAEILGIIDRHMRWWRERYVEKGYNGLLDRRREQALGPAGAGGDGEEGVRAASGKVFRSDRGGSKVSQHPRKCRSQSGFCDLLGDGDCRS
jgi:hypothetical protein